MDRSRFRDFGNPGRITARYLTRVLPWDWHNQQLTNHHPTPTMQRLVLSLAPAVILVVLFKPPEDAGVLIPSD
jgi:hypothetical protein